MKFAIARFNDSVKFAFESISKASLQFSPHQMNALQSILSGKDTFVCLPTGQGKLILFECFPHCYDFLHSCESIASAAHVCIAFLQILNAQLRNSTTTCPTIVNWPETVYRAIGQHKSIIGSVTLITQRCELIAIPARPSLPNHATRRIMGRSS